MAVGQCNGHIRNSTSYTATVIFRRHNENVEVEKKDNRVSNYDYKQGRQMRNTNNKQGWTEESIPIDDMNTKIPKEICRVAIRNR